MARSKEAWSRCVRHGGLAEAREDELAG